MQLSGDFEGELTKNIHQLSIIRQVRYLAFVIIKSYQNHLYCLFLYSYF